MEQIISSLISSELLDSITYTIVQSVWQGAIIAILTFVLFKWKSSDNPVLKYRIAILGISTLFVCSVITFLTSYMSGSVSDTAAFSGAIKEWASTIILVDEEAFTLSYTWIGYLWILGVTGFSIKFLLDLGVVQYIRFTAVENEESIGYTPLLKTILNENNTRTVLKVSTIIKAPVTIGFLKPIILFPVGMMTQLTVSEVESILSHEVAHIVRKDYLVNIAQSIMEIVLFYHPLVWWLSRVAREEREYCCDDAVITQQTEAVDYAKALVRVQELVIQQRQTLAMSFADQSLINRIKRIMNLPKANRNMREKLIAITAVLALIVFFSKDMIANVSEKIWSSAEIENTEVPRETISLDMKVMAIDTLPKLSKHSYSMTKSDDEGSISIKKENGKITKLEIDGKSIPESEYGQYENEIQELEGGRSTSGNTWMFSNGDPISGEEMQRKLRELDIDVEIMGEGFDRDMQEWAESFGPAMEEWGEKFGQSMEIWGHQFEDGFEGRLGEGDSLRSFSFIMPDLDEDVMLQLEDLMGGIDMEGIKLLDLDIMTEDLEEMLEGLDFDDSKLRRLDNNRSYPSNRLGGNRTVEDKIGYELRKDRLIATGEVSEVELSGKHMKVNGDKQPKNIWNKYKEIFEEASGIELSKDSKLKFKVEGKKTISKSSAF